MPRVAAGATVVGAFAVVAASVFFLPPQGANAEPSTLCGGQQASVSGGTYIVQNNEYNSSADECVTTDGGADFAIATSNMTNPPGAPGGYPSIYQGCHWGSCSTGGLAANPIQVANLTPGEVTTSWTTTQPTDPGSTYDVAYDIWFNHTATTRSAPDCAEVMVWLGHQGSLQPYGTTVASNVDLGGTSYRVWEGVQTTEPTISYELTSPATSVTALDLYPIARDAVSRGYISQSCYLIAVEAGFELWQGGAGLATNSFSVQVAAGGGTGSPSPSTSPSTSTTSTATATPTPSVSVSPSPSVSGSSSATPSGSTTASPTSLPRSSPNPNPSGSPRPAPSLSPSASTSAGTSASPSPSPSPITSMSTSTSPSPKRL